MKRVFHLSLLFSGIVGTSSVAFEDEGPAIVVAEGERFQVQDGRGWSVRHQEQSYATQAFGGMWVTHGGLLGAPAERGVIPCHPWFCGGFG